MLNLKSRSSYTATALHSSESAKDLFCTMKNLFFDARRAGPTNDADFIENALAHAIALSKTIASDLMLLKVCKVTVAQMSLDD